MREGGSTEEGGGTTVLEEGIRERTAGVARELGGFLACTVVNCPFLLRGSSFGGIQPRFYYDFLFLKRR